MKKGAGRYDDEQRRINAYLPGKFSVLVEHYELWD